MEYSLATLSTKAKTNQQALDMVQTKRALRVVTVATKSTTIIVFMEKLTGIQPLHEIGLDTSSGREVQVTFRSMKTWLNGYTKKLV